MSRNRPERKLPKDPAALSLIDQHYKQSSSIKVGRRKYPFKCKHCDNSHEGFIRERTEVWQHIQSKAHQKRCPEDKVTFARWLDEAAESDATNPDEEEEDGDKEDEDDDDDDEEKEEDEEKDGEEERKDDDLSNETGRAAPRLVALASAAEAAEQCESAMDATEPVPSAKSAHEKEETHEVVSPALDGTKPAQEKESDLDTQEEVVSPAPGTKPAQDITPDTQEEVVSPAPADVRALGPDSPPAPADVWALRPDSPPAPAKVKLTKEGKTEKIQEFIDTVLCKDPEFVKLRTTRHSQQSGWSLEWKTLMAMFQGWLEIEQVHEWAFSKELDKILASNNSHKVECCRLTDKPSQRLLKKKLRDLTT